MAPGRLDAVRELERNDVPPCARHTRDREYADTYATVKRHEWQASHEQITQWEMDHYLQLY